MRTLCKNKTMAYVGGLFDGEGHVSFNWGGKRHSWIRRVIITNTHKPTIDWLKRTFGGSIFQHTKPNGTVIYQWGHQSREGIERFLKVLSPCLRQKKRRAQVMLSFLRGRKSADEASRQIKEMNRKGNP